MAKVEIYFKPGCPYCIRAKNLLKDKGVDTVDYNAFADPDLRKEMLARSNGGRTYPQIFINGVHVGGSDELARLDRGGKLDPLLAA